MNKQCCANIWKSDGNWHHDYQCPRKATLEHDGKWYCKQHHPPSIAERKAKQRSCPYRWNAASKPCGTRLDSGAHYCKWHRDTVASELLREKAKAYDRVKEWAEANGATEVLAILHFELPNPPNPEETNGW